MDVAVLGAGSWGTALSILLARNGNQVTLVGRDADEVGSMRAVRENLHYLPGFVIPQGVRFALLDEELERPDLTVVAVPSGAVRDVVRNIKGEHPLVCIASKGLEAGTAKMMTEVVAEALPGAEVGVLSGPNLAVEIVRGVPTAAISAFAGEEAALKVRSAFSCRTYRLYISDDIVGVELAGALKNVLAMGAGMSDGLGFGDNTKGAFLARGLKEMILLGTAMGARMETFLGIAGVGDLFATASSSLSRNYRAGLSLGKGNDLPSTLEAIGQVVEGVWTSESAQILARKHDVEMPVFLAIESVIHGKVEPLRAVGMLMERMTLTEGIPQGS
jgi:glycerol-3-phosphate dehydrogenase (NAD(P)+)